MNRSFATLPYLEIVDAASPFDEALIIIDGKEEETIRIECENAGELAELVVRLVNDHRDRRGAPLPDDQTPYKAGPGMARRP